MEAYSGRQLEGPSWEDLRPMIPLEKEIYTFFSHSMKMTNTALFVKCRLCCEKKRKEGCELILDF